MTSKNSDSTIKCATSRVRLMENAKEIYSCECGKKYLTFSALYLHVKIKHKVRLSTKKSEQNHQVDYEGYKMVKTYFLKQAQLPTFYATQNSTPNIGNKSQHFKNIIQKYRDSLQMNTAILSPSIDSLLTLLSGYVEEIALTLDRDTELPKDLAFYFNQFSVYYLPRHQKVSEVEDIENVKRYAQDLVAFWQWLKTQRMTQVQLKLNEYYSNNPITSRN